MDLTAQTPAASTVHHPFGSPSGPGLFHVKGLQLPAYIQNIAKALQRSGRTESEAIEIAVGVVKRWAAGIGAKGKKVHPDVQAAAARAVTEWEAAKARAHAHANETGAAMTLTWNGTDGIDLAYIAPHLPAGSPQGGQFGSAQVASAAASNKAGKADAHDLHVLHEAHLAHLAKTGTAKKTTAVKKTTAKKPKAVAKPKVNKTKGTVTATVKGKKVTMTLHQWHTLHAAHQKTVAAKATKLAGGDGRFLELAFTEALAERVPPGRTDGGQFAPVPAQLSRHDTPEQAAKVINAMEPVQRAVVRASTLPPPGFFWGPADRLTVTELAQRLAARAEVPSITRCPPVRQARLIKVQSGRDAASVARHPGEPGLDGADVRYGVLQFTGALRKVSVTVHNLGARGDISGFPVDHEALSFPHPRTVAQEAL